MSRARLSSKLFPKQAGSCSCGAMPSVWVKVIAVNP